MERLRPLFSLTEVRHPAECNAEESAPQKPSKYYVCPSEAAAAASGGSGGGVGQCHVTSSMLCDLKRDCSQAEDENDQVCGESHETEDRLHDPASVPG